LIKQIANGVAYIHANNLVWMDMKAENILVAADKTPRLIDLKVGVDSKSIGKPRETIIYMDPNLLTGVSPKYKPKMDVYSFGVVAYMMRYRKHPFGPILTRFRISQRDNSCCILEFRKLQPR